MTKNALNHPGLLRELISMSGWHDNFTAKNKTVPLHLHVNFNAGEFRGEKIHFSIKFQSAVIALRIGENDPLTIPRRSVNRFSAARSGTTTTNYQKSAKGSGRTTISPKPSVGFGREDAASKALAIAAKDGNVDFHIQCLSDGDQHKWKITPKSSPYLGGSPWDAGAEPLCKIAQTNNPKTDKVDISIRFDAFITANSLVPCDIQIKRKDGTFKPAKNRPANIEAARAVLRNRFVAENLSEPSFDNSKFLIFIGTHEACGEDP